MLFEVRFFELLLRVSGILVLVLVLVLAFAPVLATVLVLVLCLLAPPPAYENPGTHPHLNEVEAARSAVRDRLLAHWVRCFGKLFVGLFWDSLAQTCLSVLAFAASRVSFLNRLAPTNPWTFWFHKSVHLFLWTVSCSCLRGG